MSNEQDENPEGPKKKPKQEWEESLPEAVRERLRNLRGSTSTFPFGAPLRKEDVEVFALVLQQRFAKTNDVGVAYIDRVVDRQLNKARGLLTYNSLILATSNLMGIGATFKIILSVLALLSCLCLLKMMYVEWGSIQTYEDWSADIADGVRITAGRAKLLTASLALSVVASVLLGSVVAFDGTKPAPATQAHAGAASVTAKGTAGAGGGP